MVCLESYLWGVCTHYVPPNYHEQKNMGVYNFCSLPINVRPILTSYLVVFLRTRGLVRTTMKVCRKCDLIHDGENDVLSASRNTTHTISLPMCLFLCNWNIKIKSSIKYLPNIIYYSREITPSGKTMNVFHLWTRLLCWSVGKTFDS